MQPDQTNTMPPCKACGNPDPTGFVCDVCEAELFDDLPPDPGADTPDVPAVADLIEAATDPAGDDLAAARAENIAKLRKRLKFVDVAGVVLDPEPPPRFWVEGILPERVVTLLGAHGGTGKSQLALQMAVCLAAGREFMGRLTNPARVAFYSAEDPAPILRHRLRKIFNAGDVLPEHVSSRLHIIDPEDIDPELFEEVYLDGTRRALPTPAYEVLRQIIEEHAIDVLILDNASDAFAGDENNRAQVRAFVRSLAKLVKARGGAVLLLAHVDKTTAKAGRGSQGYSGSTAWHNSARSRLFLSANEDGTLTLEHQKSNHGLMIKPISMRFNDDGVIVREDGTAPDTSGLLATLDRKAVLKLMAEFYDRGEHISTSSNARNNAFKALSHEPGFPPGLAGAGAFWRTLREIERAGHIEREVFRTASRKDQERWRVTDSGRVAAGVALSALSALSVPDSGHRAVSAESRPSARSQCTGGMGERARTQPGAGVSASDSLTTPPEDGAPAEVSAPDREVIEVEI